MAVWKERTKWRAKVRCPVDQTKRITRSFNSEAEAQEWESMMIQEKSINERVKGTHCKEFSGKITPDLIAAKQKDRSVGALLYHVFDDDYYENWQGQTRAVRAMRHFGFDKPVAAITSADIDDAVLRMKRLGKKPASIEVFLSSVSVCLTRAERLHWIKATERPLTPERRMIGKTERKELVVRPEWHEYSLSLMDDYPHHRLTTDFLWYVGCRINELIKLPWERVNFTERKIQFVKTKTTRARTIPMLPEVEEILLKFKKLQKRGVHNTYRGPYPGDFTTFTNGMVDDRRTYVKAYNWFYHYYRGKIIPRVVRDLKLGPVVMEEWDGPHSLRHTVCTRLANAGWGAPQIQGWSGHLTLAACQRYIHASGVELDDLVYPQIGQTASIAGH